MTGSLLASIMGIAVLDSLNPSLFLAQFFLLTTPKPTARITAFILGVLLVYFIGGLLILGGARVLIASLFTEISNVIPATVLYSLQLGLGALMVGFGWRMKTDQPLGEARKPRSLGLMAAFGFGMVVIVNEITTALPYFVAIERIAQAQLDLSLNIVSLVLYNLVFVLPLFAFLGLFLAYRERFSSQLERISAGVHHWIPRIFKAALLIVGVLLMVDAGAFLLMGRALGG
jgi:cytochrome c biogenesis protein CcdA